MPTRAYEDARSAALAFAGRSPGVPGDDVAIICRNTTEALNHLVYRLRLAPGDVVVTTVAEHHANLPHRPLPAGAGFLSWSGHKIYAPFGAGILIGPRRAFTDGAPFLADGGAVDLVDPDEVLWTEPPEREEAGSPNVIGAPALHARARPHPRR